MCGNHGDTSSRETDASVKPAEVVEVVLVDAAALEARKREIGCCGGCGSDCRALRELTDTKKS